MRPFFDDENIQVLRDSGRELVDKIKMHRSQWKQLQCFK